jgi:RecA-family ATPase
VIFITPGALPLTNLRPLDGRDTTGVNPLRRRRKTPLVWAGKDVPERKWVVPGLIPAGTVTMISGDGGLGKSLLMLMLQVAASLGVDWLGRPVPQIRSIGIYGEDSDDEIHFRLDQILKHYGVDFSDGRLEDFQFLSAVGEENSLVDYATVFERDTGERRNHWTCTPKYGDIMDWAIEEGAQLVILDSLHDYFHGNENDRAQVRYFVNQLRVIAQEIEGAVVLLAHPSVAGMATGSGASGSTAWNNAVRSRLYLTKPQRDEKDDVPEDHDIRVLKTMKANYGRIGDEIKLRWVDGVFTVESESAGGMVDHIERANVEKLLLDGLRKLAERKVANSDSRNAQNYAPKMVRSLDGYGHFSVKQYATALSKLVAAGTVSRVKIGVGPDRHPVYGMLESSTDLLREGSEDQNRDRPAKSPEHGLSP